MSASSSINIEQGNSSLLDDDNIASAVQLWAQNKRQAEQKYGLIGDWDTSRVTRMMWLFAGMTDFNEDISKWNVSGVKDMTRLFDSCSNFNQPLDSWDVSGLHRLDYIFKNCLKFNQPLNSWKTGEAGSMTGIFYNCKAFNQDLSKWDVSGVTEMNYAFCNAKSFNQNLGSWEINKRRFRCLFIFFGSGFTQTCSLSLRFQMKIMEMYLVYIGAALVLSLPIGLIYLAIVDERIRSWVISILLFLLVVMILACICGGSKMRLAAAIPF